MTYLIALIIAIALGAVIALLSFTNIGSGFAGQSDSAQAQVFANAVSQLEIASAAHEASGGGYGTPTAFGEVETTLKDAGWLRTDLQVPTDATAYSIVEVDPDGTPANGDEYNALQLSDVPAGVCTEIDAITGLSCASNVATTDGEVSANLPAVTE